MSAHLPRLNRRVLTVFLLVGLPIFVLGIALVLAIGQARLRESYGQHLRDVAVQTAATIDTYVFRRVLDVTLLGRTPELRRLAASGSATPLKLSEVEAIDAAWVDRGLDHPTKAAIFRNPVSRFFGDLVAQDRVYREVLLTDRVGRLVAASSETTDYFQGDEDWWKAAAGDGQPPGVSVSDVRWDPASRTHALEIAVPVSEPDSEAFAGVLKVVVDSRELLAVVGGVQLGATGEAVLLRRNGSIVFSRTVTDPNARYFAAETLRDQLALVDATGQLAGMSFRAVPRADLARMVGIAPSQLSRSYQSLDWLVAVSQAEDELLAPVRALGWYLFAAIGLTVLALLAAATYFSMKLAAPQLEEDLQLVRHAHVSHVGETDEEEVVPTATADDTQTPFKAAS